MTINEYLEKHKIDIEDISNKLRIESDEGFVFIGGSLAENFGNARSDIDIYQILHNPSSIGFFDFHSVTSTSKKKIHRKVIFVNDLRIDYKILYSDDIKNLWSRCKKNLDNEKNSIFYLVPHEDLELLNRLINACPIVNKDSYDLFLENIDLNVFSFSNYLKKLKQTESTLIKTETENERESFLLCRRLLLLQVDLFLSQKLQTNTRFDKWRLKKNRNISNIQEKLLSNKPSFVTEVAEKYQTKLTNIE